MLDTICVVRPRVDTVKLAARHISHSHPRHSKESNARERSLRIVPLALPATSGSPSRRASRSPRRSPRNAAAAGRLRRHRSRATATDPLAALRFRSVGPGFTSGRHADMAVDPKNPHVWYVAMAAGGLWKTTNSGLSFTPDLRRLRHLLDVLRARRSEELERGVARDRREHESSQRDGRRRHLQEHRRRRDVAARRTRALREDRPHGDRSAKHRRRVGRRAGTALVGGRRSRTVQDY